VQAAANVLNDVGDDIVGTDARNEQRIFPYTGGSRFIQNGVMSLAQMRRWGYALLALAAVPGLVLIALHGVTVLWMGLIGAAFAWAYSLPPFVLASRGLGEIAIALAFGVLPVMGAAWLQTGAFDAGALLISIPTGMWVTAILLINEVPDLDADAASGKRTLPVRFGAGATVWIYRGLHVAGFTALLAAALLHWLPPYVLLLPGVLLWLAWRAAAAIRLREQPPQALRAAIELTLRVHALGSLWVAAFALLRDRF
jgi:1,4-dihydroxy-2-naphthoate octaprenyltransferase